MDDLLSWLVAAVVFVFGVYIGIAGTDGNWEKDCVRIGAHRADGDVYTCAKRKD